MDRKLPVIYFVPVLWRHAAPHTNGAELANRDLLLQTRWVGFEGIRSVYVILALERIIQNCRQRSIGATISPPCHLLEIAIEGPSTRGFPVRG